MPDTTGKEKKVGLDNLGTVWNKVFSLIKLVTGDVDVSGKGTLQAQIDELRASVSGKKYEYVEAEELLVVPAGSGTVTEETLVLE